MEICIAWIYQSRYIKKEDGIQKTEDVRNEEPTEVGGALRLRG
jgi:hypothetical protein